MSVDEARLAVADRLVLGCMGVVAAALIVFGILLVVSFPILVPLFALFLASVWIVGGLIQRCVL